MDGIEAAPGSQLWMEGLIQMRVRATRASMNVLPPGSPISASASSPNLFVMALETTSEHRAENYR